MRNLIQFFVKYHNLLLFLALEAVSMVLLFSYNSYQGSIWVSSANAVTGKIYEWDAAVKEFFSLSEVNDSLTARNIQLEQELHLLGELYAGATHDTTDIERATREHLSRYNIVEAKVIGNSLYSPNNLITINRGEADGIRGDMGVVAGNGAVGIVVQTSEHYSIVMPIVNVHSRVSCRIRGRGYFGYLRWDAADPATVYLEDIPRHATFEVGDKVETSGYSAIFPEGVLVGTITEVGNSHDGVSYRMRVRPAVDFACLRDVRVIRDNSFSERAALMEAARDSLEHK